MPFASPDGTIRSMPRPRRILAAISVASLLALLAIWLTSYNVAFMAGVGWLKHSLTAVIVEGHINVIPDLARPKRWPSANGGIFAGDAFNMVAGYWGGGMPLWALLPIPVLGMWSSRREAPKRAGFPVQT